MPEAPTPAASANNTNPSSPQARLRPIIAIDGPAGAGKSTLAAHLARRFGFLNLETGAMYRALALKAIENDIAFDEEDPLLALALETRIALQPHSEGNRVLLDGIDVSRRIRDSDVTSAASKVSVHPRLRAWMVGEQRALGKSGGVVMEGRDIGTCVFPDAEVKIFLDAAPEVRGSRRFRQSSTPAKSSTTADPVDETSDQKAARLAVLEEMRERDRRDRSRADSPLRPADDAVILDSTNMTLDDVLTAAEHIVRDHIQPTGQA